MSKGSKRRPQQVPDKKVKEEWERLFGKRKKKEHRNAIV